MTINNIITLPDKILTYIQEKVNPENKYVTLKNMSLDLGVPENTIEPFLELLEKQGIIEVTYPFNIFKSPKIKIINSEWDYKDIALIKGKISDYTGSKELEEEYEYSCDGLNVKIMIWSLPKEDVNIYELISPEIGKGTKAMLISIMDELTRNMPIYIDDSNDPKKVVEIKEKYILKLIEVIKKWLPDDKDELIASLAGILFHKMYGLDTVELVLGDDFLEEVAINGAVEPISIYHKKYGWLKSFLYLTSESEIFNLSSQIGRKSGRQINASTPIMDARLVTGDRVASTIYPISSRGNTITIRKFAKKPWTITQFLNDKINLFSEEIAAFLWLCIQYEFNIIIAGGTASGKTSMLNVLTSFIQPKNRILSAEDTRELSLPENLYWNWVPLVSKNENTDSKKGVSMLDLIVASLRMRPDRIIVGEIRRKDQAQALFEAMHTGHCVYSTMHADTASQVQKRLLEPPIQIPKTELGSLHLIIIQFRDRKTGKRRTREIVEIIDEGKDISLNYLYRWHPRSDTFEKVNASRRIYEDLSLHAGITPNEIEADLLNKKAILHWMVDNNYEDIDQIGEIMRVYYKDPNILINGAKENLSFDEVKKRFDSMTPNTSTENIPDLPEIEKTEAINSKEEENNHIKHTEEDITKTKTAQKKPILNKIKNKIKPLIKILYVFKNNTKVNNSLLLKKSTNTKNSKKNFLLKAFKRNINENR